MKLVSSQGGVVTIGEKRGKRLLESSVWTLFEESTEEAPEVESEALEHGTEGGDTPEQSPEPEEDAQTADRPDVSVVRAWAKENGVEVSAKGRVAQQVYDAYADAHKN